MSDATSCGTSTFSASAFFSMMASLVSISGGCMSAVSPHSNLDLSLSSNRCIALGGLSLVMTICFFAVYRELNV